MYLPLISAYRCVVKFKQIIGFTQSSYFKLGTAGLVIVGIGSRTSAGGMYEGIRFPLSYYFLFILQVKEGRFRARTSCVRHGYFDLMKYCQYLYIIEKISLLTYHSQFLSTNGRLKKQKYDLIIDCCSFL